jgi:Flp pilus assembly protein CpaB
VLGVLLVAVCALIGSRLVATADDTSAVWVAERPIPAGTELDDDDLTTARVRFTGDESGRYLATSVRLDGRITLRPIGAGELVPQAATAARRDADQLEVPLAVAAGRIPADLAPGDLVDVWVVAEDQARARSEGRTEAAAAVWRGVQVVSVEAPKGSVASAQRQVLVGLDPKQTGSLATGLQQIGTGEPVLVRRAR